MSSLNVVKSMLENVQLMKAQCRPLLYIMKVGC